MRHGGVVRILRAGLAIGLTGIILGACAYADPNTQYPTDYNHRANRTGGGNAYTEPGSIFGPGGLAFLGGEDPAAAKAQGGVGIGVNGFLWRASLDTISFMPLASADPFGGVIITDWYAPPESESERFKVTVYILGRDLRADGVRAAVFRQVRANGDAWVDAAVGGNTTVDLENTILTRARQLRVAGLQ